MGTIPTIPTFANPITSAYFAAIKATSDFWALTPRCSVYQSSAQSIAVSGTAAVIGFDSEVYDIVQSGDSPSHDNATLNSRIIIRTPGKYEITGQVYYAANGTGTRSAEIRLNAAGNIASGTRISLNQQTALTGPGTPATPPPVEAALVAGDYVEIFGTQTSGGALNTAPGSGLTFLRVKLTGA